MKKNLLFINLAVSLVCIVILWYFSIDSYTSRKTYTTIQHEWVPLVAQVAEKHLTRNSKGPDYASVVVSYTIDDLSYQKEISVTDEIYSSLFLQEETTIYYIKDNIETLNFKGNSVFYYQLYMIAVMDILVIGVLLYLYVWKKESE